MSITRQFSCHVLSVPLSSFPRRRSICLSCVQQRRWAHHVAGQRWWHISLHKHWLLFDGLDTVNRLPCRISSQFAALDDGVVWTVLFERVLYITHGHHRATFCNISCRRVWYPCRQLPIFLALLWSNVSVQCFSSCHLILSVFSTPAHFHKSTLIVLDMFVSNGITG